MRLRDTHILRREMCYEDRLSINKCVIEAVAEEADLTIEDNAKVLNRAHIWCPNRISKREGKRT